MATINGMKISEELQEKIRVQKEGAFFAHLKFEAPGGEILETKSPLGYSYEDFLKENPEFK